MHYTYVLRAQNEGWLYIGSTSDIERRYAEHCDGVVPATAGRRPLQLLLYEAFPRLEDAVRRELYFKTAPGRAALQDMLRYSLRGVPEDALR